VNWITSALGHVSSPVALSLIAALVFGETAIFLGFVLPGETAVVIGGVLASRGHFSLPVLMAIVVAAAVTGPLAGYEIGRRLGDRIFASRLLSRMPSAVDRVRAGLRDRGGAAVLGGRFVAVLRALMPAAAGAAGMRFRVFLVNNVIGGVIWGIGYSLLGYLAGSAYAAVERTVGMGLAVGAAVVVIAIVAVLAWRHRLGWRRATFDVPAGIPSDPAGAPGGIPAGAPAEVTSRTGAPAEVTSRTGAPAEVTSRTGAPAEVTSPAEALALAEIPAWTESLDENSPPPSGSGK